MSLLNFPGLFAFISYVIQIEFMMAHAGQIEFSYTSNGDSCCKLSNHKTDESMKTGQSVGLFGQLHFIYVL